MGRPVYGYELTDADFSWLISVFKENNPDYTMVEAQGVPVVFILNGTRAAITSEILDDKSVFELTPADELLDDSLETNQDKN